MSGSLSQTRYEARATVGDEVRSVSIPVQGLIHEHTEAQVVEQMKLVADRLRERHAGVAIEIVLPWKGGKTLTYTAEK